MRICLVSHRLGGIDGVSNQAAAWTAAFRTLGWPVTRAAGHFSDHQAADVVVDGLWADRPGTAPPPVDHETIRRLVGTHDLLVVDNAGSLWSAPEASLAWQRHALEAGIPTIVRHHDPPWQGTAGRFATDPRLPLRDPRHLHVLINELTRDQFAQRWPELPKADALRVAYNRVDCGALAQGDRARTRAHLGVRSDDILVAHPVAGSAPRKNIPGAVEFARCLADRTGRPVRYWLTDGTRFESGEVADALARAPGLIRGHVATGADVYAAADLVVLSSTWEGWGMPVVEAAAAKRIAIAGPYPVLREIRESGITVFDLSEVAEVRDLLSGRTPSAGLLRVNHEVALARFDLGDLPGVLVELAGDARRLIEA